MKTTFLLALFAFLFVAFTEGKVSEKKDQVSKRERRFLYTKSSKSSKSSSSSASAPTPQLLITSLLALDPDLSTLSSIVNGQPNVFSVLSGPNPVTLFAPTNQAFTQLFTILESLGIELTSEELDNVLFYHALNGEYFADSFSSGFIVAANGEGLALEVDGNTIVINTSTNVLEGNVDAANGVIHIIDEVLLPSTETIAGVVANSTAPTFNTLVAGLEFTQLLDVVADSTQGPFTVFAPTDEAFAALGDLTGVDVGIITSLLSYHVVPGLFGTDNIEALGVIPTLEGSLISVIGGDQFNPQLVNFVDGFTDRRAINGVVHAIDQVLTIPGSAPLT